eukprot:6083288-Prymnesium_polylepis.1
MHAHNLVDRVRISLLLFPCTTLHALRLRVCLAITARSMGSSTSRNAEQSDSPWPSDDPGGKLAHSESEEGVVTKTEEPTKMQMALVAVIALTFTVEVTQCAHVSSEPAGSSDACHGAAHALGQGRVPRVHVRTLCRCHAACTVHGLPARLLS